jgi:uncharacterized protein (DUF1778 family)
MFTSRDLNVYRGKHFMDNSQTVTIAARVSLATRRLAEAAAAFRGLTLSRFVALAIEQTARRELARDLSESERREQADG